MAEEGETTTLIATGGADDSTIKSPSPEKLKRDVTTPYLLRRLKQTKYAHTLPAQHYSSEESDTTDTSEGSDEDEVVLSYQQRKRVIGNDNKENIETYFYNNRKTTTSNKTLHDLNLGELDHLKISEILAAEDVKYKDDRDLLISEHVQSFPLWKIYLQEGFNVLTFGIGSKRSLLLQFCKKMLKYDYCIVVNGYFPNITIRDILNSVTNELLGSSASFKSISDQLQYVRNCTYREIYLVINNIDGNNLRNERSQQVLGKLAAMDHVHIIASIDHINAPLLWDDSKLQLFNWIWLDCTNYLPYLDETSTDSSLHVKQTGEIAISSMTHVLRSLTPNAKGIFKLLATIQLESGAEFQGISFQEFYVKCREKFLVNSDTTLRTQLTEFKDHMLIKGRNREGQEFLHVPVDNTVLQTFLENTDI